MRQILFEAFHYCAKSPRVCHTNMLIVPVISVASERVALSFTAPQLAVQISNHAAQ